MSINIIAKFDLSDTFGTQNSGDPETIFVSINQSDRDKMLKSNVLDHLVDHNLTPSDMAFDLLRLGMAIYTVDQVVSRKMNGYQGWSRHLKVNIPVYDTLAWDKVKDCLNDLLCFLSGDKWELTFRQNNVIRETQATFERNANEMEAVALFSGGLDSFVSAIDLLHQKKKVAFVSHYKASESKVQKDLYYLLTHKYGNKAFQHHRFRVQPNQVNIKASKENSSRARSFLFLCLGLTIANTLGENIPLIVPENGLISLNVPLTLTRLSSHSTRTTHPYYLSKLQSLVHQLGIENTIINPYQFKTKGEMMKECKDKVFLTKIYPMTVSCSHPENSRFDRKKPGLNCGYCVPCIIRQASEKVAGEILTQYASDILKVPYPNSKKKGEDLRAFKIALARLDTIKENSLILQIMRSGPLPYKDHQELQKFKDVYLRGMLEVERFLR